MRHLQILAMTAAWLLVSTAPSYGTPRKPQAEVVQDEEVTATPEVDAKRNEARAAERAAVVRLDRVRLLERRRLETRPEEIDRLNDEVAKQAAYQEALEGALTAERALALESQELASLIDARLLRMASAAPIGTQWPSEVTRGVQWAAWVPCSRPRHQIRSPTHCPLDWRPQRPSCCWSTCSGRCAGPGGLRKPTSSGTSMRG